METQNLVIHEGKNPNPLEVVLIAQTLSCRYKESFSSRSEENRQPRIPVPEPNAAAGWWQLIIRVASVRSKRYTKCSYAYEARGIQGEVVLWGAANSTAKTKYGALQEAMVESVIKAMQHGFHTLLFLTTCRRLSQVLGQVTKPDLFEMTCLR